MVLHLAVFPIFDGVRDPGRLFTLRPAPHETEQRLLRQPAHHNIICMTSFEACKAQVRKEISKPGNALIAIRDVLDRCEEALRLLRGRLTADHIGVWLELLNHHV